MQSFVRWLTLILLGLALGGCQTHGSASADPTEDPAHTAAIGAPSGQQHTADAAQALTEATDRYFIEFRSRTALSYGHSFVIFGRLDAAGQMINPEVAGLAPESDDPAVYMLGHVTPVPASTGWTDGDLEDEYMTANWRIMLSDADYHRIVANIRTLQARSTVWHAALYNCNSFVGDIARSMGYRALFHWLPPEQFINGLREMNAGPPRIGTIRSTARVGSG
jgi:hypothetical protein